MTIRGSWARAAPGPRWSPCRLIPRSWPFMASRSMPGMPWVYWETFSYLFSPWRFLEMLGRIRTYASELAFAARTGCDLRSRLLLAVKTIQFHWHNRHKTPQPGGDFEIKVNLENP